MYGLSNLWTIKYYLSRVMFVNAIIMNILIIAYYSSTQDLSVFHDDGGYNSHNPADGHESTATLVVFGLNVVQIVMSALTLFIIFTVRVPITYYDQYEKTQSSFWAVAESFKDPLPIWYCSYFVLCVVALRYNPLLLSFLLLDWIALDSTSQDLLLAIVYQARQLMATVVIIAIMLNIFAGIVFSYRKDVYYFHITNLWEIFRLCVSYGFRGEHGVDAEMNHTLGQRLVLDVVFYIVVSHSTLFPLHTHTQIFYAFHPQLHYLSPHVYHI